jgi:hypothetical protein
VANPKPAIEQAAEKRVSKKPFIGGWRRDVVICLSLANFCFIRVWGQLLSDQAHTDWVRTVPKPTDFAAAMTAVLLLGALLFGGVRLARERLGDRGFRVARFAFFGLMVIPANAQRESFKAFWLSVEPPLLRLMGPRAALFLIALACAAVLWLVWKYQRWIARAGTIFLAALSPFVLLTFGEGVRAMATYRGQPFPAGPLAPRLATAPPPVRVVWIIFDEWDYRLTFVDRTASLAMPEIDRLHGESLFATAAISPFGETSRSLPSLITGRRLRARGDATGFKMMVAPPEIPGAKPAPWDESSSIFSVVRKSGLNVGLVGWYLPYCSVMNADLSQCAWWPMPTLTNSANYSFLTGLLGAGFWGKVGGYSASLVETFGWRSLIGQSPEVAHKARQIPEYLAESSKAVGDPSLGLVFLHVPVPHAQHPYDRFTGRLIAADRTFTGYIDSLALADRMMGEWRAAMESHGTWDHTVLLISSDHPFRASRELDGKFDRRVPFLLRFPGQHATAVFTPQFDTILSANLVYAILRGSVSTAAEASNWLERRQADRESPVGSGD